jgi:hypothetical protein
VFLAGFACKASFVTNTCLRPQGHKRPLLKAGVKGVLLVTKRLKMHNNSVFLSKNDQKSAL